MPTQVFNLLHVVSCRRRLFLAAEILRQAPTQPIQLPPGEAAVPLEPTFTILIRGLCVSKILVTLWLGVPEVLRVLEVLEVRA